MDSRGSIPSRDTTLATTNGNTSHLWMRSVPSQARLSWTIKSSWWEARAIFFSRFRTVSYTTPQQMYGACCRQNCVFLVPTRPSVKQRTKFSCSVGFTVMGSWNVMRRIKMNGRKLERFHPQCHLTTPVSRGFRKLCLSS